LHDWKTILKNFISLSGGELLSKAIAFITTIYLARIILPEGFGILGYTTAFVSYFILFIDFGFDTISIKRIANDRSVISKYVDNIISFRFLLAILVFILLSIIVFIIHETIIIKLALLLTGLNLFVQAFTTEFVFQATEKIKYLSIKVVAKNILILLLVFLLVRDISDVLIVIGISVIANVVMNIWLYSRYSNIFKKYQWEIDKGFLKTMFSESFPLIISAFMISIYYNLDMVMLGNIKTQAEVGIYNAAYKIFLIGLIPLSVIVKIFLPSLSKVTDKELLRKTIHNYGIMIFGFGIIISGFIFGSAKHSITIIFGKDYLNAIVPLMILSLNILVISVNVFLGNPLTVWGKQKVYSVAITFGAIINIILNLVLIPEYSYSGAALATLLSEVVVFFCVLYLFIKNLKTILIEGK
jgi:O-antigen/teichoic acid export membrane protein